MRKMSYLISLTALFALSVLATASETVDWNTASPAASPSAAKGQCECPATGVCICPVCKCPVVKVSAAAEPTPKTPAPTPGAEKWFWDETYKVWWRPADLSIYSGPKEVVGSVGTPASYLNSGNCVGGQCYQPQQMYFAPPPMFMGGFGGGFGGFGGGGCSGGSCR